MFGSARDIRQPDRTETLRFLALGDSYTIGQSVDLQQSFPWQLRARLNAKDIAMDEPLIIARTGWTTQNLINAIETAKLSPPYDWVSLLIGVNDQFQGYDQKHYQTYFEALIKKAIELTGQKSQRVIVMAIPDYSVTPFGQYYQPSLTQKALEQFNKINQTIARRYATHYIDIVDSSLKAKEDLSLLAWDQLHPSGKMYQLWVDQILTQINPELFRSE